MQIKRITIYRETHGYEVWKTEIQFREQTFEFDKINISDESMKPLEEHILVAIKAKLEAQISEIKAQVDLIDGEGFRQSPSASPKATE